MNGSDRCFFHSADTADDRKAAQRAGGVERSRPASVLSEDAPEAPLTSTAEVVALLGHTINDVRKGRLDPRIANSVGYLAGVMLRGLEQGEVEQRLAYLESAVRQQSVDPGSILDGDLGDAGESFQELS